MTATLTSLRARIRTQIESASGMPETLAVTASNDTLSIIRARVATLLQDSQSAKWDGGDVDEALNQALEQWTRKSPHERIGTIALSANGREIDISSLTGVLRVLKVWWDYDSTTPGFPPNWRQFEVWPGSLLYIQDTDEPQSSDTVRVWYTTPHTIDGLNGATETTVVTEDIAFIIAGAAGICTDMRTLELSETLTVDKDVTKRLVAWGKEQTSLFRYGMNQKQPAWQRYAFAYNQDDIDEAIRWALQRYSTVIPNKTIASITVAAAGREVDISSIATEVITVLRVWWDYDSSDPEYPPRWRDFEVWPGDLLFIKDADEPTTGDVVRIWYTRLHTLDGLDSETATSFSTDAETLIVTGASGFVAQERVQETAGSRVPTRLREWADARLKEFERLLALTTRQEGARHSGIALAPALDRWDNEGW